MRKTLFTSAMAVVLLAITAGARADSSYAVFLYDNALDWNGQSIVNGTAQLIVDVNGNGIVDPGIDNSTTWQWDPADIVLGTSLIGEGDWPGTTYPAGTLASSRRGNGVDSGDSIYFVWVDKGFGSAAPGANTHYGAEVVGTVGPDNADYTFYPVGGRANQTTVPEPATMGLLALGLVGLISRRRNRKA